MTAAYRLPLDLSRGCGYTEGASLDDAGLQPKNKREAPVTTLVGSLAGR